MKDKIYKYTQVIFTIVFFALAFYAEAAAQTPRETRREAARLQRLATYVWEGMVEDVRFGHSWDQRALLDVFNFANGTRYLNKKLEDKRVQSTELREIVDLLVLQSKAVERSLRIGRAGRTISRDWGETKDSLDSLARLFSPEGEPPPRGGDVSRTQENVNDLRVEIKEVRHSGNIFKSKYRIRGVVSGRNIVSVGIYYKGRLIKSVSVRLHERRFIENEFSLRMKGREGQVTLRVIDDRGFVLEKPIEFPEGGLLPGFK